MATLVILERFKTVLRARILYEDCQREGVINLLASSKNHLTFETSQAPGDQVKLFGLACDDLQEEGPFQCEMEKI